MAELTGKNFTISFNDMQQVTAVELRLSKQYELPENGLEESDDTLSWSLFSSDSQSECSILKQWFECLNKAFTHVSILDVWEQIVGIALKAELKFGIRHASFAEVNEVVNENDRTTIRFSVPSEAYN